jgi:hypothetical protein
MGMLELKGLRWFVDVKARRGACYYPAFETSITRTVVTLPFVARVRLNSSPALFSEIGLGVWKKNGS